ncbi:TPA: hypothetical protein N0F65_003339 [Lagenidium giganteum]|uniref:HIG1 domain-containing protein n=1 Tax=Lagenidium giganteum TaxID=4803 RepID=A0AAV2ZBZ4_9STRA|nr:TPA: hypothetical protein N0F65_003339 [Lagenidium giganteum]
MSRRTAGVPGLESPGPGPAWAWFQRWLLLLTFKFASAFNEHHPAPETAWLSRFNSITKMMDNVTLFETDPKAARAVISSHAYKQGMQAAGVAGFTVGTGVLTANKYSPTFRRRLGISGKWALVVSSFLATFSVVAEKEILACARNPEQYLAKLDPSYVEVNAQKAHHLKLHQRLANFLYDHPYRALATVGVPLVGGIYAFQSTNKAISASQQIMHTRIYGQGAVVLLLLSSMAFHDYMQKHGRFGEDGEYTEAGVLAIPQTQSHTQTDRQTAPMSTTMTTSAASEASRIIESHPTAARDIISWHAYTSGLEAGAITASISGTAVLVANKYWPAFQKRLGPSGKMALVLSTFMGAFAIVSDRRLLAGARNPQKYLESMDPNYVEDKIRERSQLKLYQRAANFVYDHPYRALASIGVPLVGSIYVLQSTNKAITASQQIMHTRIYGQGAVVALLLASMGFHDYMQKRGRFVEEDLEANIKAAQATINIIFITMSLQVAGVSGASSASTRDAISWHAYVSGLNTGAVASVMAGSAVFTADKYWPAFHKRLGPSGKMALVISPFLGVFAIVYDRRLVAASRNPEQYLASMDPNYEQEHTQRHSGLPLHQRAANFLYDHPYRTLATVGVPLVGSIYAFQRSNTAISASQQIMHTRIYGQGAVVVLLLASMGFHDYMLRRDAPAGVAPPPSKAKPCVNRPVESRWTQQNLRVWEPMLTLGWAIIICVLLSASCAALGIAVLTESASLNTHRVVYDGGDDTNWADRGDAVPIQEDGNVSRLENCLLDTPEMANRFHANNTCFVSITLREAIHGVAHVYYEVSGFLQNHRRFVSSINKIQFTDEWRPDMPTTACAPMEYTTSELCQVGTCDPASNKTRKLFPCGIVANTMFNDIIWLHNGTLPSGATLGRENLMAKGVARKYPAHNFVNPTWNLTTDDYLPVWNNPNMSRLIPPPNGDARPYVTDDYTNSTAWVFDPDDPDRGVGTGLENEHWRVWVEIAAHEPFRKAYGRIEGDLPAGTQLTFAVQSNFFVRSFGGSKALVVARLSWFGSENKPLGAIFIAVGSLFLIAAIGFTVRFCKQPRKLGDASALAWKFKKAKTN